MRSSFETLRQQCHWLIPSALSLVAFVGVDFSMVSASEPATDIDFVRDVAPIFERRCLSCHDSENRRGEFSLELREHLDESGYVVAGEIGSSYLLDLVTPTDGQPPAMPKEADPLSDAEIETLCRWIESGADWPEGVVLAPAEVTDTDWWSLRPLHRPNVPANVGAEQTGTSNPIDAFIRKSLREHELTPSEEADRRTLMRRLYFDLIGLPPTPEEIEQFIADEDPLAYERLVDRLLASPHYGERWARHWLDVAHYGETHGYDKDQPRPNAWPYRDYVIGMLNADKPYSDFIREQIAGDVIAPTSPDAITALGFLAAGPWDLIGHAEVPETKIDGKIARHLDRDDMVRTAITTFCSVTVGCAQCHNHKFDPISQEDYYALQAVFAAVDRADKPFDSDPAIAVQRQELATREKSLLDRQKRLHAAIAANAGPRLAELDGLIAEAGKPAAHPPEHGYHSQISPTPDATKWVQLDLGDSIPIDRVEFVGCYDDFNAIGAGFGFPVRYRIELSDDPSFESGVSLLVDETTEDVPNPGITFQSVPANGRTARFIRFTATKLAPRQGDYIFALAELRVIDPAGENRAFQTDVTALDTIEAPIRWSTANLVDDIFPRATSRSIDELQAERDTLWEQSAGADRLAESAAIEQELATVRQQLEALPPQSHVYAATVHHGTGNFRGTGPDGGTPRPIHLLHRGDVKSPRAEVGPGTLSCVETLPSRFVVPQESSEGARRLALADWIAHRDNPLTWRSIANRIWQYHFGRGLAETANDFGRMGTPPNHPELLDWLACEVRDGRSLKSLHRLIVTSATYRQSSQTRESEAKIDVENRFLWRMNRHRLEAEAIRDSILAVAGNLDPQMGGPSFQDFVIEKPEHSPHYRYDLFDVEDHTAHRRAIYRLTVRSQTQPFLTALDCADPSMQVDRRNESNTPLQALAMLNDRLLVAMSNHFAESVATEFPDPSKQVEIAFRRAIGRSPSLEELSALRDYTESHGLAATCRVILNLNEFLYID